MDFAKKILNKYGWKEGEGLGKNGDGICKPLKASMKFDNAGFGADQASSDFNNHWWERVFNEAAQNVEIKKEENGLVSMNLKNTDDTLEISTKGYSVTKLKKAKEKSGDDQYDNFIQSSILTQSGGEMESSVKVDYTDIEVNKYKVLSDEELFRACGGRTAHKGARHGLKLSGKLSRIQQQEEEMLKNLKAKQQTKNSDENKKPKKRRKNEKEEQVNIVNHNEISEINNAEQYNEISKKCASDSNKVISPNEIVSSTVMNLKNSKHKNMNLDELHEVEIKKSKKRKKHKIE